SRPVSTARHEDRMSLQGRTAVVTGAGGGIGRAIAVELGRAGASLVLVGRREETLAQTAEAAIGAPNLILAADISQSDDVRRFVGAATSTFGTIDVLINNAGVEGPVAQLAEYPEDEFDRVIATNLRGTFLAMRHVLPIMLAQRSGSIVNLGSVASERGLQGTSGYIASKHGVLGLTRAAASEVASSGVRVNAICAGMVDTRMLRAPCQAYM